MATPQDGMFDGKTGPVQNTPGDTGSSTQGWTRPDNDYTHPVRRG